jgi:hypothetical protein
MVIISISDDDEHLAFRASGQQFMEEVESFKYLGMRFDPSNKVWLGELGLYEKYLDELSCYGVEDDEYTKRFLVTWHDTLKEQKKIIKRSELRKYNSELMKVQPYSPSPTN